MEQFRGEQYNGLAEQTTYAGFGRRLGAYILDGLILGIPLGMVSVIVFVSFLGNSPELIELFSDPALEYERELTDEEVFTVIRVFFGSTAMVAVISMILSWLYFALFHSSKWQATLGKKILGIKVADAYGERIRFGRATGRYFAKALLSGILLIGYIIAAFTERKQALHDLIAGTIVVEDN